LNKTVSIGVRLPKELLDYVEEEAKKEKVDRTTIIRKLMEKGIAESKKERAAQLYMEGKISISGAADIAALTIPEMVEYLVSKGYKSSYSLEDFRRGVTLLEKRLKHGRIEP